MSPEPTVEYPINEARRKEHVAPVTDAASAGGHRNAWLLVSRRDRTGGNVGEKHQDRSHQRCDEQSPRHVGGRQMREGARDRSPHDRAVPHRHDVPVSTGGSIVARQVEQSMGDNALDVTVGDLAQETSTLMPQQTLERALGLLVRSDGAVLRPAGRVAQRLLCPRKV
jgi:hypothetical protein